MVFFFFMIFKWMISFVCLNFCAHANRKLSYFPMHTAINFLFFYRFMNMYDFRVITVMTFCILVPLCFVFIFYNNALILSRNLIYNEPISAKRLVFTMYKYTLHHVHLKCLKWLCYYKLLYYCIKKIHYNYGIFTTLQWQ